MGDKGGKIMAKEKIRIRLKAYDHRILDQSAVHSSSCDTQIQRCSWAVWNAYAQTSYRHC